MGNGIAAEVVAAHGHMSEVSGATNRKGNSVLKVKMVKTPFEVPRLFFTLKGCEKSEKVLAELAQLLPDDGSVLCRVFETAMQVQECFESGVSPASAVVLVDASGDRNFQMLYRGRVETKNAFPAWSYGAQWGVAIKAIKTSCRFLGCAQQIAADFRRNFIDHLANGEFPWGRPKKNESAPAHVVLPGNTKEILTRLNSGPDFAAAIAHTEHALELPKGSKISWCRVAAEPITVDVAYLTRVVTALRKFEEACGKFTESRPDLCGSILAGVDLPAGEDLRDLYLHPRARCFSVSRPDLHYTGEGVFASEIDEMPGGLPDLIHIDHSYGLNESKWESFFTWLTESGPVLFIVSNEWSKCYIEETKWLAEFMRERGHAAAVVTTDRIDEVSISDSGVSFNGSPIGTIWRQFPIFETCGKLAKLVVAAHQGIVRMVPEFGHFGNKAWFSLYRKEHGAFEILLDQDTRDVLDEVLPDSYLVESELSFPCTVAGVAISNLLDLMQLPVDARDKLVLKVCGANAKAARSYGVLMGHGLSQETWSQWIRERLVSKQPFIIQRRLETGTAKIAVHNTKINAAELFHCRILLRPWVVNGEIVSVHACAVPSNTLRVHGMVDMSILPVVLGSVG